MGEKSHILTDTLINSSDSDTVVIDGSDNDGDDDEVQGSYHTEE